MRLTMLKRIYYWLHRKFSSPEERNEYSKGYWQDIVRQEVLILCREIQGKVLEVGCGEGLFLTALAIKNPELEIWGVDNNSERVDLTKQRTKGTNFKNINLSVQDAANLSFEEGWFDTVICINTIYNLINIDFVKEVLEQMKRVCKKSGKIIIDFRNSANFLLRVKYKLAHLYDGTINNMPLNTYNLEQIEGILRDLNLDIVNKRFIGFPLKRFAPIIIIVAEKRC